MNTNVELAEMKLAWQTLDRRLAQQHALNLWTFRDRQSAGIRRRLRWLRRGQVLQIIGGAILMLLFAPYWVAHLGNVHLMVYGLVLHAYGLTCILTAARNLYLQSRLDDDAPVLELQHRLAKLRSWRLWEALIHGVANCFMWIPLLLIGFQTVGADLWVHAPAVVWAWLASGVACVAIMAGLIGFSRRPGHERLRAALERSSIGRSVHDTQAMLAELAQFEHVD